MTSAWECTQALNWQLWEKAQQLLHNLREHKTPSHRCSLGNVAWLHVVVGRARMTYGSFVVEPSKGTHTHAHTHTQTHILSIESHNMRLFSFDLYFCGSLCVTSDIQLSYINICSPGQERVVQYKLWGKDKNGQQVICHMCLISVKTKGSQSVNNTRVCGLAELMKAACLPSRAEKLKQTVSVYRLLTGKDDLWLGLNRQSSYLKTQKLHKMLTEKKCTFSKVSVQHSQKYITIHCGSSNPRESEVR